MNYYNFLIRFKSNYKSNLKKSIFFLRILVLHVVTISKVQILNFISISLLHVQDQPPWKKTYSETTRRVFIFFYFQNIKIRSKIKELTCSGKNLFLLGKTKKSTKKEFIFFQNHPGNNNFHTKKLSRFQFQKISILY